MFQSVNACACHNINNQTTNDVSPMRLSACLSNLCHDIYNLFRPWTVGRYWQVGISKWSISTRKPDFWHLFLQPPKNLFFVHQWQGSIPARWCIWIKSQRIASKPIVPAAGPKPVNMQPPDTDTGERRKSWKRVFNWVGPLSTAKVWFQSKKSLSFTTQSKS